MSSCWSWLLSAWRKSLMSLPSDQLVWWPGHEIEGPLVQDPPHGNLQTEHTAERTWGWKLKFLRRASQRNNCRLDAAAKPADTAETWASWMMVNFYRRSFVRSSLGESSSVTKPPSNPPEMCRWRTFWPTPRCPNIHDVTNGMKMGSCCQWIHGHPAA